MSNEPLDEHTMRERGADFPHPHPNLPNPTASGSDFQHPQPQPQPQTQPQPHSQPQQFFHTTATVPLAIPVPPLAPAPQPRLVKKKWYDVDKPHPLLWITLGLSILAVILGVPKGSLPTLTGRHKTLRAQEILVQERLTLLTQLSAFLPPPLAALMSVPDSTTTTAQLDMVRLGKGLQLWHTTGRVNGNWWTLEDLGSGAHVVRAATADGRDREVWVLRTADSENEQAQDQALLAALTNSLMARERLYAELDAAREPCPPCPAAITAVVGAKEDGDKWAIVEERMRHVKERAQELEEREQDVVRREMWVVDAMRKLSDKSHNSASELDLEDRVVERLKAYQRQIKDVA